MGSGWGGLGSASVVLLFVEVFTGVLLVMG
jgi:hypothetical protein